MNKVYLISAKRSAIGSMLGTLKDVSPTKLGADVLRATLEAGNVKPEWLNEVIVGNVLPAGVKQGPARQVAIGAGVPVEIPAYSLNMVCGSGMKSVMNAYTQNKLNEIVEFSEIVKLSYEKAWNIFDGLNKETIEEIKRIVDSD